MKKFSASIPFLLFLILGLPGCTLVGSKSASQSVIYGATALLSLVLLAGCCRLVGREKVWFVVLFSSVPVVNIGYTVLSLSTGLSMALWANRLAYLGSVFLPLAMLMIILDVTGTRHPRWLPAGLAALAGAVFLVAASPGILPIYYREVSFAVVNGVSTLVKVYGPLHPLYLFYLLGYFIAMVTVILRARNTLDTPLHAGILAAAVFVNIGVWLIEQLVQIDFEMLSISYIISELFLLGLHLVMEDYRRMHRLVRQVETMSPVPEEEGNPDQKSPQGGALITPDRVELFVQGLKNLTPTERAIYDAYIARLTTWEIMEQLHIKETTLKYHNRNLYGKLGVASRKELMEVYKHLQSLRAKLEESKNVKTNQ